MKTFNEGEISEVLGALALEQAKVTELEQRLYELQSNQKPAISNELLNQFKQLLKAFKRKQEEQTSAQRITENTFQSQASSENLLYPLENELQQAHDEKCALQHQIFNLKTAFENSQQTLSQYEKEKEKQHGSLAESRVYAEQLEKVVKILREKSEAAHLEIEQLQRELQAAHDNEEHLLKRLSEFKSSENALITELANVIGEKSESLEEILSMQTQFVLLRDNIRNLQLQLDQRDVYINASEKQLQDLEKENRRLLKTIEEKSSTFVGLENEVVEIKQSLISGLREAKDLEDRYLEAIKEKVEAISKFSQLQRSADKQRLEIERRKSHSKELIGRVQEQQEQFQRRQVEHENEIHSCQKQIEEKEKQIDVLNHQTTEAATKLSAAFAEIEEIRQARQSDQDELEKHEQIVQEKEAVIKDILDRLIRVEEDKNLGYDELGACREALKDKECQFDEAQQHLAKKVREAAWLDAKIDELTQQLSEENSQRSLLENEQSELKIILQNSHDEQALLNQKIHTLMIEIERWQDKHSQLELKCQTALQKIDELEKISARHQQLQSLVFNFGNFFKSQPEEPENLEPLPSNPQHAVPQFGTDFEEPKQTLAELNEDLSSFPEITEKKEPRHYRNLFDVNIPSASPKKDLFE